MQPGESSFSFLDCNFASILTVNQLGTEIVPGNSMLNVYNSNIICNANKFNIINIIILHFLKVYYAKIVVRILMHSPRAEGS
jgi:hypothetical protein